MTIFPRWLTVGSIHINEHHQLADWGRFPPPASSSCWNLLAIINQGHLSISPRLTPPQQNYVHSTLISIRKSGRVEWIYTGMLRLPKWMSLDPKWNSITCGLLFMVHIWVLVYQGIKVGSLSPPMRIWSVQFPACLSVYPKEPLSVLSGVQGSLTNIGGRPGHRTCSQSNKQAANLNIITAMLSLLHERHNGKIFTLCAARISLAAKSY